MFKKIINKMMEDKTGAFNTKDKIVLWILVILSTIFMILSLIYNDNIKELDTGYIYAISMFFVVCSAYYFMNYKLTKKIMELKNNNNKT